MFIRCFYFFRWTFCFLVSSFFGLSNSSDLEVSQNKLNNVSSRSTNIICFDCDILYWKAVEDGLKYAESGITNSFSGDVPSSTVKSITQPFPYSPGLRLGASFNLFERWEMDVLWTRFYPFSDEVTVYDLSGNLFAGLAVSAFAVFANENATMVSGGWTLKMNTFNLEMKHPFIVGTSFKFSPLFGVQGSLVKQDLQVLYSVVDSVVSANTPQKINGHSNVWAVGPEIGLELEMLLPRKYALYLKSAFACMTGSYSVSTEHAELTNLQPNVQFFIKEAEYRLFSSIQLQGGVSKWWQINSHSNVEIIAGWETQFWPSQQRFNWLSTLSLASNGADLSLWGPFIKASISF